MGQKKHKHPGKTIATCHISFTDGGEEKDQLIYIQANDPDELSLKICYALARKKASFSHNGRLYRISLSQVFDPRTVINMGNTALYRVNSEQKQTQKSINRVYSAS